MAGDSIYIRGVTYYPTGTIVTTWQTNYCGVGINNRNGSAGNPITESVAIFIFYNTNTVGMNFT